MPLLTAQNMVRREYSRGNKVMLYFLLTPYAVYGTGVLSVSFFLG